MLAQFQARYPTASLISELLTIYQGKFVVRVSAQVEGVLRATGLAASESLELAEDQARNRALVVLGIKATAPHPAALPVEQPVRQEPVEESDSNLKDELLSSPVLSSWYSEPEPLDNGISFSVQPEINTQSEIPFGNVIPLVPSDHSFQDVGAKEPIDLSDAIERTTVELKRLGWNNQQGREYLKQTYNKRSRQELTDEEMLEFLRYLESQPSPNKSFT